MTCVNTNNILHNRFLNWDAFWFSQGGALHPPFSHSVVYFHGTDGAAKDSDVKTWGGMSSDLTEGIEVSDVKEGETEDCNVKGVGDRETKDSDVNGGLLMF